MNVLEILDPTGHLTLRWDPANVEDTEKAREEFNRLKGCGFAFFSSDAPDAKEIRRFGHGGELDVRPVQTKEFKPDAPRTVAVRPLRGG